MRYYGVILGTFLLAPSLHAGEGSANSKGEAQVNSRFAVAIDGDGNFEVEDLLLGAKTVFERKMKHGSWQLIPTGHWLEFQEGFDDSTTSCLLDLEKQVHYCDASLSREPGEEPWSPGGTRLVWGSRDQTRLHFVKKADEANLVAGKGMLPTDYTILGDPLGLIWQQRWLSEDRLLIGTSSGESICFGVVDLAVDNFYLLECCGTPLCPEEEFREARRESEKWLLKKGHLDSVDQWKIADPEKFPWGLSPDP